jgi:PRTRC genetic system protein E
MTDFASYGLDTVKKTHDEGQAGSSFCPWCNNNNVEKGFSMCFSNWCICPSCVWVARSDEKRKNKKFWQTMDCWKCKKEVLCFVSPTAIPLGICVECLQWAHDVLSKSSQPQNQTMPTLEESLLKCKVEGCVVYLPPMSEGPLENYQEVRKALLNAGAKYKSNTFVFPNEAQLYIDRLVSGESVNIKKEFQFFATPADIAQMMISYLPPVADDAKVLEPSAGDGALIKAFLAAYPNIKVDAFELLDINRKKLEAMENVIVLGTEFIAHCEVNDFYDIIIANPPFTKNQDIDHIRKMYEALKPGGTIIALASPSWTFGSQKKQVEFKRWLEELDVFPKTLQQKSFASSGTQVVPVLLQIQKPVAAVSSSSQGVISGAVIPGPNKLETAEYRKPAEILEDIKSINKEIDKGIEELQEMISEDQPVRKCRVCGCTDSDCRQCIEKTGEPCYWVDDDLCSACVQLSFEGFHPRLLKLQKEHSSFDQDWWRSRWHDWIDMKADDPEWKKKHELELIWPKVWERYKDQFCKSKVEEHQVQSPETLPPGEIETENEASEVEENETPSPEVIPDAYQDYLDKRNSSSIIFTEMKFFEQLKATGKDVHLSIDIKEKNGKYTVMVLPKASDGSRIQPIVVTGTSEELDEGFFKKVGPVLVDTCMQLMNVEEHKKSVSEAAKTGGNKSTPAASSSSDKPKPKGPAAAAAKKSAVKKSAKKEEKKIEETPKVKEQVLFA